MGSDEDDIAIAGALGTIVGESLNRDAGAVVDAVDKVRGTVADLRQRIAELEVALEEIHRIARRDHRDPVSADSYRSQIISIAKLRTAREQGGEDGN